MMPGIGGAEVLRRMKEGVSIAIAADGPRGPERVSSTVPLVWARSSGKRVFISPTRLAR